jgi:predicted RNase H-like nuclease
MLLTLDGFMSKLKDAKTTMTSGTALASQGLDAAEIAVTGWEGVDPSAGTDDVLDALVGAWTAGPYAAGAAQPWPTPRRTTADAP